MAFIALRAAALSKGGASFCSVGCGCGCGSPNPGCGGCGSGGGLGITPSSLKVLSVVIVDEVMVVVFFVLSVVMSIVVVAVAGSRSSSSSPPVDVFSFAVIGSPGAFVADGADEGGERRRRTRIVA